MDLAEITFDTMSRLIVFLCEGSNKSIENILYYNSNVLCILRVSFWLVIKNGQINIKRMLFHSNQR